MKINKFLCLGFAVLMMSSCGRDFLEAEDTEYLTNEEAGEVAARKPENFLNGMWTYFVDAYANDLFGHQSVLHIANLMGEDLAFSAEHFGIYDYDFDYRLATYQRSGFIWENYYTEISKANEIISMFPDVENGSSAAKNLVGQALAMRGMSYFYMIQFYQKYVNADGSINREAPGIPLKYVPAADGKESLNSRNTVGMVLDQIESDLTRSVKYLTAASDVARSSKNDIDANVANGLLARYYLMTQQWEKAETAAQLARKGYSIMSPAELHDGFMEIENAEWMWGFKHSAETHTQYASFFSHISNLTPGYAGLMCPKNIDARLYSQIPDDDERKTLFNGPDGPSSPAQQAIVAAAMRNGASMAATPYANLKFGNNGEWTMDYVYMRASEMVLIEAEALARQNKNTEAATVLKELMAKRQPSWNMASVTVDDVYLQRRIELWGEGYEFFDRKRMNLGIDRNYEGSNHLTGHKLAVPAGDVLWTYQLPKREIQENDQISEDDQND